MSTSSSPFFAKYQASVAVKQNNSPVTPEIRITSSSPTSFLKFESLALSSDDKEFDARSVRSLPPAYPDGPTDVSIPIPAYLPSQVPEDPCLDALPTYDHAKVDKPPKYHAKGGHRSEDDDFGLIYNPIEPQKPWSLTKRLYVFGFVFFPLWFIGMGFSVFGKTEVSRRWGRRCAWNSLVVLAVFSYLVVAYFKTDKSLY